MDELATRRRELIIRGATLVCLISAWMMVRFRRLALARPSLTYGPIIARDEQRQKNLTFIFHSDDTHCVNTLRMRRTPFFQLCDLFRNRGLLRDSIHSSIEEQVAMFLHVVGHNQRFRCIQVPFLRSLETISWYFQEVLYAVGELRTEMILTPSTAVPTKIQNSRRWNPYFKDCVGAIDGTHMLTRVPAKSRAALLGAGWEGSAHDALILSDALQKPDGLKVPQGKFFLVDAGYAVRLGFLPPYRGTRYHLREYGVRSPRNARELFNLRHSSLRVTVERAFGA